MQIWKKAFTCYQGLRQFDKNYSQLLFYRFRLFMFLVSQIPAFHVPGFTDSGFSCSWFYRFRLFMFLVLQIPAFHVPGFTDSGFSCSWFYRFRLFMFLFFSFLVPFIVPFPDFPFLVLQIARALGPSIVVFTLDLFTLYMKCTDQNCSISCL